MTGSAAAGANAGQGQGWPRAILHLDMDAFFVSIHVLDHPEDAGQPIAVGGSPRQRGVVASASYEARRHGVRSAMPMRTALHLCPGLKVVGHDWRRIQECSRAVMAILKEYGPLEPMGVDEAYVDLSDHPDPVRVAEAIRERVRRETHLPASVGLATSKLVAKVASDHDKPEGCTIVRGGDEGDFLAGLPTRAIPGVGPKTAQRLAAAGIETCGQLASAPAEALTGAVGRHGESLRRRALGIDDRPVAPRRPRRKSISRETTFPKDVGKAEVLAATVASLAHSVAGRMRHRGLAARTVVVKLRWSDFTTLTRQTTLPFPTDREAEVARAAMRLWRSNWPRRRPVRLIGVGVSGLVPADVVQMPLDLKAPATPDPQQPTTVRSGPPEQDPPHPGGSPPGPTPGAPPGSRGP